MYRRTTPTHRNRWLAGLVAATTLTTVLAGCSSARENAASEREDDGDLSASAQQCLDKANAFLDDRGLLPDELADELTPLSEPPTRGLTITRLYPGSVPSSGEVSQAIVDNADELGWTGKKVAFDGSVEDVNRKLLEAIDDSDIVEVDGFPPAAVQPAIAAAKEKGVLLMLGAITDQPESIPGFGAVPNGGDLFNQMGELAAYSFMRATRCQGNMAAFGLPFDAMRTVGNSAGEVVERECENCTFSYTDIQTSDIGSPAATNTVVSKLQSDPSIDFAFFTIGDLALGIRPAMTQAGVDAEIGGALPLSSNLADLQNGDNSFWVGAASEVTALSQLDSAARALDSGQTVVGNRVPLPIFTQDNLESADPVPVYPTDILAQFKQLWLVE
ncbi:hypothetical protein [Nocardioides alkalitolerans]|uniref:hypothetical protein n=1 Tax=Nocardioides alkalitolerans TaxID=281714 RepID=UPI0004276909|nr:hypothetical protein [Nocardioides alkalitolerans]